VVVVLVLLAAVIIRALTVGERFEMASLGEEDPVFLRPDTATQLEWAATLGGAIKIQTVSRWPQSGRYINLMSGAEARRT
jgi:hypothetical protein